MAIQAVVTDAHPEPLKQPPAKASGMLAGNGFSKAVPPPRRFERPDIERHGAWLLPRFTEAFPHLDNRQALSFMVNVLYSNEFMFLFQDHGVALAQVMQEHALAPRPVVWERFVFLENKENARHVEEGGTFYDEFARWAKQKQAISLVVAQLTDVPLEAIKQHLGRIFVQEMQIARL